MKMWRQPPPAVCGAKLRYLVLLSKTYTPGLFESHSNR
jgi:hypothetical protein